MNVCHAGHEKHDRIVVDTDLGKMTIYDSKKYMGFNGYCSGQDDISRTLQLYGRWEVEETECVRRILEAGNRRNLVIDIGSHIGWFGRLAEEYGYSAIGYEADTENIELYKLNTKHGIVKHIWFDEHTEITGALGGKVELMKIDIEGAERFAIAAFKEYLPDVNNILMEVSPTFNDGYPDLVKLLQESGFNAFYMGGRPFDDDFAYAQTNLLFTRDSAMRFKPSN